MTKVTVIAPAPGTEAHDRLLDAVMDWALEARARREQRLREQQEQEAREEIAA